jgi:hypothetical protein
MIVYAVFGQPFTTSTAEFLAVYSTRERAQAFIGRQPTSRQPQLSVSELRVDEDPSDPFWTPPQN